MSKPQTAWEVLQASNDSDALTRARLEECSAFFRTIADRMIDEWPRLRVELACHQARQYLRDGAPGKALEVLEEVLGPEINPGTSQPPF